MQSNMMLNPLSRMASYYEETSKFTRSGSVAPSPSKATKTSKVPGKSLAEIDYYLELLK